MRVGLQDVSANGQETASPAMGNSTRHSPAMESCEHSRCRRASCPGGTVRRLSRTQSIRSRWDRHAAAPTHLACPVTHYSSPDDSFAHPPPTTPASTGRRHLRACKRQLALRKSSMPQTAESVGGSRGRQRYVHRKSGKLRIPRRPARANGRRQQYQDGILLWHVHAQGGSIIV